MLQQAWDLIEQFYNLPHIDPVAVAQFQSLQKSQSSHTKKEGNPQHYCAFFLPYDRASQQIYLGHHKKANDWIPPGGHIEPCETPIDTAIREMQEELDTVITPDQLEPFALSVKPINRPESGCMTHYDVWYLVNTPVQPFKYLETEYYDAGWFPVGDGIAKIQHNPDFARIISMLGRG